MKGVFFLIIFLILVGVGFFFYDKKNKEKMEQDLEANKKIAEEMQHNINLQTNQEHPVTGNAQPASDTAQQALIALANQWIGKVDNDIAALLQQKIEAYKKAISASDFNTIKTTKSDLTDFINRLIQNQTR